MKWIDENTVVLSDSSICIIKDEEIELYPPKNSNWKTQRRKKGDYSLPKCVFPCERSRAKLLLEEMEKLIEYARSDNQTV